MRRPVHVRLRWLFLGVVAILLVACSPAPQPAQTQPPGLPADEPASLETASPDLPVVADTAKPQITATLSQQLTDLCVVYIKDGDIWRWTRSGTEQLTHSADVHQPRLSSDGKIIAFLRPVGDFHVELWAVDASGKNERLLVSIDDLNTIGGGVRDPSAVAVTPYQVEWVPGTHLLAFNTRQVFQGPGLSLLDDFHLVDADSLELKFVLLPGWGGSFTISPDGKKIVLSTPNNISLANLDGTNYAQVMTYTPVITYGDYRFYPQPVWSAESQELRVAIPPEDPLSEPAQPTSIWLIPADGSNAVQTGSVDAVTFFERQVSFSPDLQTLAYLKESGAAAENLRELYLAKADGSGAWLYQRERLLQFLGWSASSEGFLYAVGEDQQLWYGGLDSSASAFSGDFYNIAAIQWLDGQYFLFGRQNNESFDLYLGSSDGSASLLDNRITSPPQVDFFPRYSGD